MCAFCFICYFCLAFAYLFLIFIPFFSFFFGKAIERERTRSWVGWGSGKEYNQIIFSEKILSWKIKNKKNLKNWLWMLAWLATHDSIRLISRFNVLTEIGRNLFSLSLHLDNIYKPFFLSQGFTYSRLTSLSLCNIKWSSCLHPYVLAHFVCPVLGLEFKASCMLGKQFTNWTTFPSQLKYRKIGC